MADKRVVLLGDSVIDNGAYVRSGEADVAQQLQALLPDHEVAKRAVDGTTCAGVLGSQIGDLRRADHIIRNPAVKAALR